MKKGAVRRGRPQRLPVDPTPVAGDDVASSMRVAWLLATSRLLAPDADVASRTRFVERVRARGVAADQPRVSRWESGAAGVDASVVTAYEAVLGLTPGVLSSAAGQLRQYSATTARRRIDVVLGEEQSDPDAVFERIAAGTCTGVEWVGLARTLVSYERVYLSPGSWRELCDALVSELTRSSGPALILRTRAAGLLTRMPAARRQLSLSVGRFVMHPDAQSVIPALSLLRLVTDGQAGDLVVRLMGSERQLLRRGAAEVVGSIATLDGFVDTVPVEAHAVRAVARGRSRAHRLDGLDLLTYLPDAGFARVLASLRDPDTRARVMAVRSTHELAAPEVIRAHVEQVARHAENAHHRGGLDPDQMLRRLVREALFHARRDRRNLAVTTLAASAYADAVGSAVLELTRSGPTVAASAWSMLRRMGHTASRLELGAVAAVETRDGLRSRALATVGHGHGPLDDDLAASLARHATGSPEPAIRASALTTLGLAGHPVLADLTADPGEAGRAARWWAALGPALHDVG